MTVEMATGSCKRCGITVTRRASQARRYPIQFCSVQCKAETLAPKLPVTEEWLRQKYVVEEKTCPEIAAMVNRDAKSVWSWLTKFGIQTRRRGTYAPAHFKKAMPSAFKGRKHSDAVKAKLRADRMATPTLPHLTGAGPHWLKGKSGAIVPSWKGGVTPERQAHYSSDEWKRAVVAVWRRDNAICQRCKLDSRTVPSAARSRSFCVHHIVTFAFKPLRCEPTNLVLLCRPCHLWIHSNENANRNFIKDPPEVAHVES